jgi:hypothetical protein
VERRKERKKGGASGKKVTRFRKGRNAVQERRTDGKEDIQERRRCRKEARRKDGSGKEEVQERRKFRKE